MVCIFSTTGKKEKRFIADFFYICTRLALHDLGRSHVAERIAHHVRLVERCSMARSSPEKGSWTCQMFWSDLYYFQHRAFCVTAFAVFWVQILPYKIFSFFKLIFIDSLHFFFFTSKHFLLIISNIIFFKSVEKRWEEIETEGKCYKSKAKTV